MQASIKEYVSSEAHKKERRDIDKQLTKVTQQISGTCYIVSVSHRATSGLSGTSVHLHHCLEVLHDTAVFWCLTVSSGSVSKVNKTVMPAGWSVTSATTVVTCDEEVSACSIMRSKAEWLLLRTRTVVAYGIQLGFCWSRKQTGALCIQGTIMSPVVDVRAIPRWCHQLCAVVRAALCGTGCLLGS